MTAFFTNPSLYILQTKLVSPNSQGNSRWTVINPDTTALYGAVGKDVYPRLLQILKRAGTPSGVDPADVANLVEKGLLTEDQHRRIRTEGRWFLDHYHEFVHDYRFHNYASVERFRKDREQMAEYGKIQTPPSVYTQRDQRSETFLLAPPRMDLDEVEDELQLLSNILSGTFLAVGQIEGGDFGPWLRKASPSGGARHPTEAWVMVYGKRDIADGLYYFDAPSNQLFWKGLYRSADDSEQLALIITAHVERPMWRYRESRSFRAVLLDAGHCMETLNQLSVAFGWTLKGRDIPQAVLQVLDLQDIALCALDICRGAGDGSAVGIEQPTSCAPQKVPRVERDTEYRTNPFLWGSFTGAELTGTIAYPQSTRLTLSDDMLRILSYAQVSRRGDRPSTPGAISASLGVPDELIRVLVESGLLLEQERVKALYAEAAHWIAHGWYQNLLLYLEYRSTKIHASSQQNLTLLAPPRPEHPGTLWRALSRHRKTTRSFTADTISAEHLSQVLAPCLELLQSHASLELFHLKRHAYGHFEGEKWNKASASFVAQASVAAAALESAVIGQSPIIQASNVLWLSISVRDLTAEGYFNALMVLGIAAQKLCIQCALLGLGIFVTPASNDGEAATISQLDSLHTINYFAAIGHGAGAVKRED